MSLKLKYKSILLVVVPLVSQTVFIVLLLVLLRPYETALNEAALYESRLLAIKGLYNDAMLLRSHLMNTCPRPYENQPDYMASELESNQLWLSGGGETQRAIEARDAAAAHEAAAADPFQILKLNPKEHAYWTDQSKKHIQDLNETAAGAQPFMEASGWISRELNLYQEELNKAREYAAANNTKGAVEWTARARQHIRLIDRNLQGFRKNLLPTKTTSQRLPDKEIADQYNSIAIAGLAANVALSLVLIWLINGDTVRRFKHLAENIRLLSEEAPMNAPLRGNDELAIIDASFHSMELAVHEFLRKRRAIVDNACELICVLDQNGKIESVNQVCEKMIGLSEDKLKEKSLLDLTPDDQRADCFESLQQVRRLDLPAPFEASLLTGSGNAVPVLWSARWSPVNERYYCVIRDISQQKELARLKQNFVDMLSTDLKVPLTTIQTTLTDLSSGKWGVLNEDGLKQAGRSQRNNVRLLELVEDLLHLDELSSGQMKLNLKEQNAADLVQKSIDAVEGLAKKQKLELKADAENITVAVDGDRIVQVLVNLLGNSCKFSPRDKQVICSARLINDYCEFAVRDFGRGIPKALCASIFEKFKQVTKTDATEKGGSGLGLAICKTIVESHGGAIGVDSVEGEGSTFWFRVPLKPREKSSAPLD